MKKIYLENIYLENYRNFTELSLTFGDNINIIVGKNGTGKTNILESMSLLSPGKGLKSAHFDEICSTDSDFWKSSFCLQSKVGSAEISTSFLSKTRKICYNGSRVTSSEIPKLLNIIWLTPQMEGLFLGSSAARRKFLDRIVYNFNTSHATHITKYEHFMRERSKVLLDKDFGASSSWLTILENKMAIEAEYIDNARRKAVNLMQEAINSLNVEFPRASLKISLLSDNQEHWSGFVENYSCILANNRQKDAYSGRTNFGVHKSDLIVKHQTQQRLARLCSTGEQKALLISLVLASIEFILQITATTPILLLDELFVHLDDSRTKNLAEYVINSKLQTFITTTNINGIEKLASNAQIINL